MGCWTEASLSSVIQFACELNVPRVLVSGSFRDEIICRDLSSEEARSHSGSFAVVGANGARHRSLLGRIPSMHMGQLAVDPEAEQMHLK